jgi:hypothetical protein
VAFVPEISEQVAGSVRDKVANRWNSADHRRVCVFASPEPRGEEHEATSIDNHRDRLDAWNRGLRPVTERAAKKPACGAKPTQFKSDELQFVSNEFYFIGARVSTVIFVVSEFGPKRTIGAVHLPATGDNDEPIEPEYDKPGSEHDKLLASAVE